MPNCEEEAEAPFDAKHPDDRINEWGLPVDCRGGPAGLCWHNIGELASSAPHEFVYAEGLALNHDEWSLHAWVVRKSDGKVVECTAGYRTSTLYRGICLEVAEVDAFIDNRPMVKGKT